MNYLTEPLDKKSISHNIGRFDCGTPVLNDWLKTQAGQAARKGRSVTYVIADAKHGQASFYLKYGFTPLNTEPQMLFIRIDEIPVGGIAPGAWTRP